jgi:hypothetical protein
MLGRGMKTKKICIIFICLLLLIGCAHEAQNKTNIEQLVAANPGSFVEIPQIGFFLEERNFNEVFVTKVIPNSSAEKSDIHVGDIILSLDRNMINSGSQLSETLLNKRPGESIVLTIKRNLDTFDKQIILGKIYVPFDAYILRKKIIEGKPVRLAIIVGGVSTAYASPPGWNKAVETKLLTETENFYIRSFMGEKNFEIVDRAAISNISNELNFQQSHYVSDEFRIKLGKVLGVTDLLILRFSRFRQDTIYRKLIDVKTGKVLASIAIKDI